MVLILRRWPAANESNTIFYSLTLNKTKIMNCAKCQRVSETTTVSCAVCGYKYCSDCLPIGKSKCVDCHRIEQSAAGAPSIESITAAMTAFAMSSAFTNLLKQAVSAAVDERLATRESPIEARTARPGSPSQESPGQVETGFGSTPVSRLEKSSLNCARQDCNHDRDSLEATGSGPENSSGHRTGSGLPSLPGTGDTGRGPRTVNNAEFASSTFALNKTATMIQMERSIQLDPITKEQRAYRVNNTDLPHFSGDGCDWFIFYATYEESTLKCNFSPTENLRRLSKALQGIAKEKVSHLLDMPHKLPKVLEILKAEFTRPKFLMENALRLSEKVPFLK